MRIETNTHNRKLRHLPAWKRFPGVIHHNRPVNRDLASGVFFGIDEKRQTVRIPAFPKSPSIQFQTTDYLLPKRIEHLTTYRCQVHSIQHSLIRALNPTQITPKTMSRCRCDVITPEKRGEIDYIGHLFHSYLGDDQACSPSLQR
jgi:hypothetical protein